MSSNGLSVANLLNSALFFFENVNKKNVCVWQSRLKFIIIVYIFKIKGGVKQVKRLKIHLRTYASKKLEHEYGQTIELFYNQLVITTSKWGITPQFTW